jgi:hypothetical protein
MLRGLIGELRVYRGVDTDVSARVLAMMALFRLWMQALVLARSLKQHPTHPLPASPLP